MADPVKAATDTASKAVSKGASVVTTVVAAPFKFAYNHPFITAGLATTFTIAGIYAASVVGKEALLLGAAKPIIATTPTDVILTSASNIGTHMVNGVHYAGSAGWAAYTGKAGAVATATPPPVPVPTAPPAPPVGGPFVDFTPVG